MNLPAHVHSSQRVEATQVFLNRWTGKQNIECMNNGIWLSFRKEKKFWHVTLSMSLENIMLTEISKRKNTAWFHLYEVPSGVGFMETEHRVVVVRDWGKEGEGMDF